MAAISSNRTGIRKAFQRLFKGKEETPVKQNLKNPSAEEEKKAQEELDYRRERRQGNKPVNVPKKSTPSVIPAEESPKLKSQKQTSEKKPQRLVSNQGVPLKFIEETQKAKREEASKPIDEQIKGSVKKKEVKVKSGQDVISDDMSFGKAFRAARNEGMKTFTWRGKKYGTSLKKKNEQVQNKRKRRAFQDMPTSLRGADPMPDPTKIGPRKKSGRFYKGGGKMYGTKLAKK